MNKKNKKIEYSSIEELRRLIPEPVHPAADRQPLWSLDRLHASIAEMEHADTVMEPIQRLDGKIIDGRHRRMMHLVLGTKPHFRDVRLPKGMSPEEYVAVCNDMRRHLTKDQLAAVAAVEYIRLREQGKLRRSANLHNSSLEMEKIPFRGNSLQHLQALYDVNSRYIQQATTILELEPTLFAQLHAGQMSLKEARLKLGLHQRESRRSARAAADGDVFIASSLSASPSSASSVSAEMTPMNSVRRLAEAVVRLEHLKGAKLKKALHEAIKLARKVTS